MVMEVVVKRRGLDVGRYELWGQALPKNNYARREGRWTPRPCRNRRQPQDIVIPYAAVGVALDRGYGGRGDL